MAVERVGLEAVSRLDEIALVWVCISAHFYVRGKDMELEFIHQKNP